MDRILLPFRQNKLLNTLFISNAFISYHYALVIYINSSFLNKFFTENQISSLYIIGSIINVFLLLNASKIIQKIGTYKFSVYSIIIEFIAIFGLIFLQNPLLIAIFFISHLSAISLAIFSMDIFVEKVSSNDEITGSIRGAYLTITNTMIVIAPLTVSFLIFGDNYSVVYLLSSMLIIPLYFLIKKFNDKKETALQHINVRQTLEKCFKNKNVYNILISHTILQMFYGFMVIYTPIYLQKYIGFSWSEIGIIFTIMLLPFILFELPIGEMEDDKYGEKEFLTIGFVVMGMATLVISFITLKNFWFWASILFISRIGASLVEISVESYFFKQVNKDETDVVGMFRIGRPLSLILSPIIATIVLQFIPFQYIFIIIGSIVIMGTKYSLALQDTK